VTDSNGQLKLTLCLAPLTLGRDDGERRDRMADGLLFLGIILMTMAIGYVLHYEREHDVRKNKKGCR